jgi:hypothetical protein
MTRSHPSPRKLVAGLVLASLFLGVPLSGFAFAAGDVNEASCPNEGMAGFSAGLPDCRAYEQVSPTEKDGGSGGVYYFNSPVQADERLPMQSLSDGSAITYPGEPFFDVEAKNPSLEPLYELYTSERSTNRWNTHVHDTLAPEAAPTPPLPPLTETNGHEVTQSQVLEETPDGSKAFFLDERELIPGTSNPAPGEPDLYEYTMPSGSAPQGELVDLTIDNNPGPNPGEKEHGDARGILGAGGTGTEEGSYIYFVAGGMLAPGASSGGCGTGSGGEAIGEGCNLYLRHDGVTTFVVTLPPSDEQGNVSAGASETRDWPALSSRRTAEVSPGGRYLVFGSRVAGLDGGSAEIFRYDAEAAEKHEQPILCLSCGPAGGRALLPPSENAAINGANRQRYALDNGRVLFTTAQQLVPQDVNHQPDVYEWEDGSPRLISAGTSESSASVFADAGADGGDIFFTTSQSLTPSDQDGITDVYDAREGGGWPSEPAPDCPLETACPGPVAPSPTLGGAPASATFAGVDEGPPHLEVVKPPPPAPTRAELLAKALRACHGRRGKKQRATCEASARKRYGPVHRPPRKKHGRR